jgi:glycosyltransferase involved in cell wall biosynthesis
MHILLTSIYHLSDLKGGNERYTHELALGLTEAGHQVTYLTSRDLPIHNFLGKPIPTQAWHSIPQGKFDLYHACGSGLPLHLLAKSIKPHFSTILTFQGPNNPPNHLMRLGSQLEYRLISSAYHGIITSSPQNLAFCHKTWPKISSLEIPLSLSDQFLSVKPKKTFMGTKLLFVAKLDAHHYYKGLNVLLQTMPYLPKDYSLTIVGDGPLKSYYQQQSLSLNLMGRVKFVGEITEARLLATYQSHDLFIFPSTNSSEGFGLSLVEAMAVGLPAITTTCIGIAPILKEHRLATLIPPNQPRSLTSAVLNWPNTNHQIQINKAYAFAHSLTRQNMANKTIDFYQRFLC